MNRSIMCVLAATAFVACASNQQYTSSSAAGTVDLSAYPMPSLDANEVRLLREMSDANILGHLEMADSLEAAISDTVIHQSKSDAVTDFAKLMRTVHTADYLRNRDIGKQTGLKPTTSMIELNATHLAMNADSVRLASDLTIDQRYVRQQIDMHGHVLAELQTLHGVARNPILRDQIASMIPVVRDHLSRAHALAIARGYEKKRS